MRQARAGSPSREMTLRTLFWALFWATIVVFALLYTYAQIKVVQLSHDAQARVMDPGSHARLLLPLLPEVFAEMQPDLDASLLSMEQRISTHIDTAFEPVYARIPAFLDFHYSVVGEYTELAAALSDRIGSDLQRILFTEADFERHRENAIAAIGREGDAILAGLLDRLNQRLQERLALEGGEMDSLPGVVTLTIEDAVKRFGSGELMLKGAGAVVGASAVATMVSKTVGTKLAAKLATKTAVKATGLGGAAAGGALAGSLCGPAAWICAPVAAIIAGAAAWVATDKIVIEADEYLNRESLEGKIREAIDDQRQQTKEQLAIQYRHWVKGNLEDTETRLRGTIRELIDGGS